MQGQGSRCLSPKRCNRCLSSFRDGGSMHRWRRSSQSAQSKDLVTTALVYMRAPTKNVVMNKHTAAQMMIHFSSEYGLVKLGTMPGGGCMLGMFAMLWASAISSDIKRVWNRVAPPSAKNDADCLRKSPKRRASVGN